MQGLGEGSQLEAWQVQDWNAGLWVQRPCSLIWLHCPFSLSNLCTSYVLFIPETSRKTKGIILFSERLIQMWVLVGSGVSYSCSRSLHGDHLQVWGFWYFKNPVSAGILQPAGGLLCRVLAPSLLPRTLEGAEILGPQIKAKSSIQLGRKEKAVFCAAAGRISPESVDAVLPVPRVGISLQ